jgi:hypothetical protein
LAISRFSLSFQYEWGRDTRKRRDIRTVETQVIRSKQNALAESLRRDLAVSLLNLNADG